MITDQYGGTFRVTILPLNRSPASTPQSVDLFRIPVSVWLCVISWEICAGEARPPSLPHCVPSNPPSYNFLLRFFSLALSP